MVISMIYISSWLKFQGESESGHEISVSVQTRPKMGMLVFHILS